MLLVALALGVLSTSWTLAILVALLVTRRPRGQRFAAPVTLLRPLAGADPGLAENLRSVFRQDHTNLQILLGAEGDGDPAIPIAREVLREFPEVDAKLVVHCGGSALNPKVRNLLALLPHAKHDLLLVSDSNVRAPPDYVADAVATRLASGAGVVTHVFAGAHETSWAGIIEASHLNGFVAGSSALPTLLGDPLIVGKSMLMSRRELEALGGFARVANVLAEDFLLGKMYLYGGYRVALGRVRLTQAVGAPSLGAVFGRLRRWAAMRYRLRAVGFALEPVQSPMVFLLAACLVPPPWQAPLTGWALLAWVARDVGGWLFLRGSSGLLRSLVVAPLREVLTLLGWASAPFVRVVSWRGRAVRLGAGTLLFPLEQEGPPPDSRLAPSHQTC